jgi:hypothetical protein
VHAADDDSIPVPHDAFRVPRGMLKWKKPYLFTLLVLGGGYGALALAHRVTPTLRSGATANSTALLQLPLLAQVACALVGLAALVFVLSRAVREVDKRPYVAIAPVFAAFAGLVHAGVHAPLAALGAFSALVAYTALAVALLGGAFILRDDEHSQHLGWGLVVVPSLLILLLVIMAKGELALDASERGWLVGLMLSSLVLGAAGVVSRALRNALPTHAARSTPAAWSEELVDAKTTISPAPRATGLRFDTVRMQAPWLLQRWRPTRMQLAAIAGGVALLSYVGVRGGQRSAEAPPVSAPAFSAPTPAPVIEQLDKPAKARASTLRASPRHDLSDKVDVGQASAPARAVATPARAPTSGGAERRSTGVSAKPARAPSSVIAPSSPPGLPAWGDLGTSKPSSPSKGAQVAAKVPVTPKTTPATPMTTPAPPKTTPATSKATALAPLKPAAPSAPAKPLTMDQVLDRVEDVAQAQRNKSGRPAPKTSKRDAELDALISGSMKSKPK